MGRYQPRHSTRTPMRFRLSGGFTLVIPGGIPLREAKALRDRCDGERPSLLPPGAALVVSSPADLYGRQP